MTLVDRLARAATWLGQRVCGLRRGHYFIRTPEPRHVRLVCIYCGLESPGWTLSEDA